MNSKANLMPVLGTPIGQGKYYMRYLEWQMKIAREVHRPVILTCSSNAFSDLFAMIMKCKKVKGVIHNFSGTPAEAREAIRKGFYIGLSPCSMATKEGMRVAKEIPLNRLLMESGSPTCNFKKPHAGLKHLLSTFCYSKRSNAMPDGFVKGRTEPAHIIHVAEALAGARKMDAQEVMDVTRGNIKELFFTKRKKYPPPF